MVSRYKIPVATEQTSGVKISRFRINKKNNYQNRESKLFYLEILVREWTITMRATRNLITTISKRIETRNSNYH